MTFRPDPKPEKKKHVSKYKISGAKNGVTDVWISRKLSRERLKWKRDYPKLCDCWHKSGYRN